MASAVQIKVIKPERFKDEAFKAAIDAAARQAAEDVKKDFEKTTETWQHKPDFEKIVDVTPPDIEILIGTDDEIYGYVNDGTRPHIIRPRQARVLSFQWGGKGSYRAKTRPRQIWSRPGGPTGPRVQRRFVRHPGTQAREFDKTIEKLWQRPYRQRMERAMRDGARASGHGIP